MATVGTVGAECTLAVQAAGSAIVAQGVLSVRTRIETTRRRGERWRLRRRCCWR